MTSVAHPSELYALRRRVVLNPCDRGQAWRDRDRAGHERDLTAGERDLTACFLSLRATVDGWSLLAPDGEMVFRCSGDGARRRCLELARDFSVLVLGR